MNRQTFIRSLVLSGLGLATLPASARDWPDRPVRLLVGFPPGSYPDQFARAAAEALARETGGTFLVDNKPGAGGAIALQQVAAAAPDGASFAVAIGPNLTTSPLLYKNLPYKVADLALVTKVVTSPSVLVVNPKLGVTQVSDFVELLKREPGKHNYGMIGQGSTSHVLAEEFAARTGTRLVPVQYKGSPDLLMALMRGDISLAMLAANVMMPPARTGQVIALAVTSRRRSTLAPDLPTLIQAGIPIEADAWNSFVAPARTPPAIVDAFRTALTRAFRSPEMRPVLDRLFMEVEVNESAAQFASQVREETARWRSVFDRLNLTIE